MYNVAGLFLVRLIFKFAQFLMLRDFVPVTVFHGLNFNFLSIQGISQFLFPHHLIIKQFSAQILDFFSVLFIYRLDFLRLFFKLKIQVLNLLFHLFVSIFRVTDTPVMGVNFLLNGLLLSLQFLDSVFEKFFL